MRQPDSADSLPASPRRARFPFAAALLLVAAASIAVWGALSAVRSGRAKAAGFAGARFLWISAAPETGGVRFSALRRFRLSESPRAAAARVFVDRRFELWINGKPAGAGGEAPGEPAASIPVAPLLHPGENTLAIVATSPDGVGAILFALDTGGEAPAVVSDADWTIDPTGASVMTPGPLPAAILGPPPRYPWGLPTIRQGRS